MAEKWAKEKAALKKIQLQIEFQREINRKLNIEAAESSLQPTDWVRKLIGLEYKKIQRNRLGLSFSETELQALAARYDMPSIDEKEIKRRIMEEVNLHFRNQANTR